VSVCGTGRSRHGVQEVSLEEADAARGNKNVCSPIDRVHLNKREPALNDVELIVQDVHVQVVQRLNFWRLSTCRPPRITCQRRVITRNSLIGPAILVKHSIAARIRLRTSVVVRSKVAHRHRAHRQRRLRSIARFPAKGARHSRHSPFYFRPRFSVIENA
jgi:hypothetical protein